MNGRINLVMATVAAVLLAGCGSAGEGEGVAAQLLEPARVAALLSPEAKAVVESYEADVRKGVADYKAQYGRLPANLGEIPSAAAVRQSAVAVVADGLAEQVPFASRATVEKAATAFVSTAEQQVLDRMKAQDATNR